MAKLMGQGTFRDDNGQDWNIEVRRTGIQRFETTVVGPDGNRYRPEDDLLGDMVLVDEKGKSHGDALPMDMGMFQMALERIEDHASMRRAPNERGEGETLTPPASAAPQADSAAREAWVNRLQAQRLARENEQNGPGR